MVGIVASSVSTTIGVLAGLFAGYYRGVLDSILMRSTEVMMTIPEFYLYILLTGVLLTRTPTSVALIIGVIMWTRLARIVRSEVLSLRERDFVRASRGLGAGDLRLIFRHLLPNCLGSITVTAALNVSMAILLESSLSFLGLSDPTAMSLGVILMRAQEVLRVAWWPITFPGVFIFLTAFAFVTIGDGVRDALDPRLRGM